MSQENVEVVRRTLEAYASGDNETALAMLDPAVVIDWTTRPDGGVFRGREGVVEAMRTWTGTFEDWTFEPKGIIDADDCVLLVSREIGRGKGSGVEIERTGASVITLRNGKIIHWQGFNNRDEAFKAAGLRE
jgi:ketosteroid isomerase-like protein